MISSSEKQIAMIAERAICLPKLEETVWIWIFVVWNCFATASLSALVSGPFSVCSRSWKLLYSSPLRLLPRPWTTGSLPNFVVC